MVNYNYRVKFEYLKERKDGKIKLEDYGFVRFVNEEDEEETIYASPVKVEPDCVIVRGLIADLNNPDWQKAANITNAKRRENFKKNGLEWEKQSDGTYKVIETPEMIEEFRASFLCVATDNESGFPHGILLLKGPDGVFRGGSETLMQCCPEAVKYLLDNDIIYKVKAGKRPEPKKEEVAEA